MDVETIMEIPVINLNLISPDPLDDVTRNAVKRNHSGKSSAEVAIPRWRAVDARMHFIFYDSYFNSISAVSALPNYIAGYSVWYTGDNARLWGYNCPLNWTSLSFTRG